MPNIYSPLIKAFFNSILHGTICLGDRRSNPNASHTLPVLRTSPMYTHSDWVTSRNSYHVALIRAACPSLRCGLTRMNATNDL